MLRGTNYTFRLRPLSHKFGRPVPEVLEPESGLKDLIQDLEVV